MNSLSIRAPLTRRALPDGKAVSFSRQLRPVYTPCPPRACDNISASPPVVLRMKTTQAPSFKIAINLRVYQALRLAEGCDNEKNSPGPYSS